MQIRSDGHVCHFAELLRPFAGPVPVVISKNVRKEQQTSGQAWWSGRLKDY
jgi:hypothetical protein